MEDLDCLVVEGLDDDREGVVTAFLFCVEVVFPKNSADFL